MRILYVIREDFKTVIGGDTTQILKTKEYIEKKFNNVEIVLATLNDLEDSIREVDFVHIFNIQTIDFTAQVCEICKNYNKKVLLSPIFWDLRKGYFAYSMFEYLGIIPNRFFSLLEYPSRLIYWMLALLNINKNIFYGKKKKVVEVLRFVDKLLPNSNEELQIMKKNYKVKGMQLNDKAKVIPNAIEILNIKDNNENEIGIDNYVLQVGRIGAVKNQLSVIRAMSKNPEIALVFIGAIENKKYYNQCLKESNKRGNVFFIQHIEYEKLTKYYEKALCHVNPSFRESPGLVSLEALKSGIPIVISDARYCPVVYYEFDIYGNVCDPFSVPSIKKAIFQALEERKSDQIRVDYFKDFCYEKVAELTYNAYQEFEKKGE